MALQSECMDTPEVNACRPGLPWGTIQALQAVLRVLARLRRPACSARASACDPPPRPPPRRPDIPGGALEGLEAFSHVWVVYVFHANTDLGRLGGAGAGGGHKGRVRVPRLGGARLGVLATRSPHRPLPIGALA